MSSSQFHVLLMPEDFIGASPSDHPVYATVVSTSSTQATVGLLSAPHVTAQVRLATARARRVDPHELDAGAVGEWLRKPVVGVHDGLYVYGQVVAYDGSMVTIRTTSGKVESTSDDLDEVAPVLCFLLAHAQFDTSTTTPEVLSQYHVTILDRLLGRPGRTRRGRTQPQPPAPTRSIPRLLAGIVPTRLQPAPGEVQEWIQADSGTTTSVSCRHAIDFAYFIDGKRQIPRSLLAAIGRRFDEDPSLSSVNEQRTMRGDAVSPTTTPARLHGPNRHTLSSPPDTDQDPLDQLDALLEAVNPTQPPTVTIPPTAPASVPADRPAGASMHARVLEAIADKPELVRFYLSMCQTTNAQSTGDNQPPTKRPRLEAISDLVEATERHDRRPKHEFQPSKIQQAIQRTLGSPEYKGKEPMEIVEAMLSSRATKFKPIPAVIIRVFAFEFGARGLSIMHFTRFDFAAKRAWYASASCNLNNFSASISLPKPDRPTSLDDLSNVLTVLHVFVDEFMDHETSRLVSSSREFVEELRSFSTWSPSDVETLTFWFDSLFESYRAATEVDCRQGSATRCLVRSKLSLQDPDLQSVLYIIQSERFAAIQRSPTNPNAPADHSRQQHQYHQRHDQNRTHQNRPRTKTPQEVIDALPRRGRLTACMKYLSRGGCSSKSDERCAFPNHVHLIPEEGLHPVVFKHIEEKMGGVRDELRR